jgi:hypothetical protein
MKKFLLLTIICMFSIFLFASEINIGGKKIVLPSFESLVHASSVSQELVKYMGQAMPANLRTLDGYVEQTDALRLNSGKDALFDKYIIIVTPTASIKHDVTTKEFTSLKNYFRNKFDVSLSKQKGIINKIDQTAIKVDKVIPLGINCETNSFLSAAILTTLKVNTDEGVISVNQVATINCLLVNGRIIFAYVYKKYRNEDDLRWVQETGKKLSEEIISANKQMAIPNSDLKKFTVNGHPKAKGAKFSIEMPASWEWKEGKRPNIVQLFGGGLQNGLIPYAEIMVKKFSDSKRGAFAELTAKEASNPQNLQGFIPKGAKYVRSGITNLDGEIVLWYEMSQQTERAHNKITSHSLYYLIPDNGRIIFIIFAVGQAGYHANSQVAFNIYRPLFQRIISSFVLTSKWE